MTEATPHVATEQDGEAGMRLTICIPSGIFLEASAVGLMLVETVDGFYGFLPNRRDCIAILVPGILTYHDSDGAEVFVAVADGVVVKSGTDVLVSVRRSIVGTDLEQLHTVVEREFKTLDEEERGLRAAMAKLESGFVTRAASFQNA